MNEPHLSNSKTIFNGTLANEINEKPLAGVVFRTHFTSNCVPGDELLMAMELVPKAKLQGGQFVGIMALPARDGSIKTGFVLMVLFKFEEEMDAVRFMTILPILYPTLTFSRLYYEVKKSTQEPNSSDNSRFEIVIGLDKGWESIK